MGKAERTRQFIVEKTAALFNTKGFAGTSLADIAEATGLTKGSVYGNFANKDEVALAVFDYNFQKVKDIISQQQAKQQGAINKLLVYVEVHTNFLQYPLPVGGCPVLNTATEADDTHPDLRKKAIAAVNHWKQNIEELIHQGQKSGEISANVNGSDTALAIIATIEGAIMLHQLTGDAQSRKIVLQSVKKQIEALR